MARGKGLLFSVIWSLFGIAVLGTRSAGAEVLIGIATPWVERRDLVEELFRRDATKLGGRRV